MQTDLAFGSLLPYPAYSLTERLRLGRKDILVDMKEYIAFGNELEYF